MNIKVNLGFASFAFLFLVSCQTKTSEPTISTNQDIIEVQLAKPGTDTIGRTTDLVVNGKLESYKSSNISSRIMGNVTKLLVREGQAVKQGQLLLQIQSSDLLTQKAKLEESMIEAQVNLILAQKNYSRFKTLHEQASATDFELEQSQLNLEAAKSRVGQLNQSIAQIRISIAESQVKSPFDGTVTAIYAEIGTLANPGMPLLVIETSHSLVLKALVPESEIQHIDKTQEVVIQLQHNGDVCTGRIQQINPSSQMSGSQFEVEINPDAVKVKSFGWKAGMFATAKIKRQKITDNKEINQNELTIPKQALIEKGQLYGVFTVSDDQIAILRWVRVGKDYGDRIEIISGLHKNESFITEADSRLYNGARVQVK